jgi:hypothetical protein
MGDEDDEQLHRAQLDIGDDLRGDQAADGDLRDAPATQAAERRLHGPGHAFENERFQWVREQLQKEGVKIPMPTGN